MTESGTQELIGYSVEGSSGQFKIRLKVENRHLNRIKSLHGGIVSTLLDVACGYEANHDQPKDRTSFYVTVSLTTNFMTTAKPGDNLVATAEITGGGRSVRYVSGWLRTGSGQLIATASGVFKLIRKSPQ